MFTQNEIDEIKHPSVDLHCSRSPVSSMPGSSHSFPVGSMCDTHDDRPAVRRVQGETDSFGCEYLLMCQECVQAMLAYVPEPAFCEGCKTVQVLGAWRDPDEGQAGPVYHYCRECRQRMNASFIEESMQNFYSDDDFADRIYQDFDHKYEAN